MRNNFFALFIFLISWSNSEAQDSSGELSVSFNQVTLEQAFEKLENITEYRFFYAKEWLVGPLFSGEYRNASLGLILEDMFRERNLNFYFHDNNQIIITQNSAIYDALPNAFLSKNISNDSVSISIPETLAPISNPVLNDKNQSADLSITETFRIGKADKSNNKVTAKIDGFIINKETKEPIPDLQIIVNNLNIAALTSDTGFYRVELPIGTHIVDLRALGIENKRVKLIVFNDGRQNFELNESIEILEEVILELDRDKNVSSISSGKDVIDTEESKNIPLALGERDVLRVASTLPGISTAGEGAEGFNVRGGRADQNLILLDDAVIYNPQHFFGVFSALNPSAIGEFNIYKGSLPSEYGGRLSSVFDIRTKSDVAEKIGVDLSIGPVTSNALIEVPVVKSKSSLMVGGRGAYANWILRSLDEPSLNRSEASFYDALASYTHKINEKSSVKVTGYLSRDDFSITSDSLYIYQNKLVSGRWDYAFNNKNSASLTLSSSQYDFDIEFDGDSNNDFLFGYNVSESEAKLKFTYLYSPKLRFKYGVSGKFYSIDPGNIEPISDNSITNPLQLDTERGVESAIFLSSEIAVSDRFSIEAGLRYSFFSLLGEGTQNIFAEGRPRTEANIVETLEFERNETIETFANPEFRFSSRYLFNDEFSVKASFGRNFQYIHRLSNNTTVSPIDTWKLSDLNIEPQRSDQYTLGFFKNFDENTFELSLEGFYKDFDNILDFKTGAQILLNENIATETLQGDGESYGVELLIRKNRGKLNGWLGYTYSRSFIRFDSSFEEERINDGDFFPANFDRPHDISLITNYKFSKRFSFSSNFVYQTGRPVTVPVGNFVFDNSEFVVFSDRNSFRIPDFYRLDIGFNIEGNHKKKKLAHSFWTISVYNVLGRNNPFSVFFLTDDGEIRGVQTSIFTIPVPSITYNIKF
ncbi:MAG: TonB-dependent receptor [Bacteroidota bacterium]